MAAALAFLTVALPASAHVRGAHRAPSLFTRTDLVADSAADGARLVDPDLTNAWGLASLPGGPLWVSDNNSGDISAYSGGVNGGAVSLTQTVVVPGGNPSGEVGNPDAFSSLGHSVFPVGGPGGLPAYFVTAGDSIGADPTHGEIAAWDGGATFVVEDSPTGGPGGTTPAGAIFKGLAVSTTAAAGPELYATDVANARVEVFDRNFTPLDTPSEFVDPSLPAGYAPFGIQVLKGKVYVSYGLQDAQKDDVVPGAGLGYVDVYSVNGALLHHLVAGGAGSPLDEPWGLAIAPARFGHWAGKLLVGNLGNGEIDAFNPKNGKFAGTLTGTDSQPIVIDGLWALSAGTAAFGGPGTVVFSAGPNSYADGVVGILAPAR